MAQRKFLPTDTAQWGIRYGNGSAGLKTHASSKTINSSDGFYNGQLTATAGASTGATTIGVGAIGKPCVLIQNYGAVANYGEYELNYILDVSGGVVTFLYPVTQTYTTGGQIIAAQMDQAWTLNAGVNLSAPAWDGFVGGVGFVIASESVDVYGSVIGRGLGLRSAAAMGYPVAAAHGTGHQGEGYTSVGAYAANSSSMQPRNTTGGGGGAAFRNTPWTEGAAAGGGANYTDGQDASWIGGANIAGVGQGGLHFGVAGLLTMGGAGGDGAGDDAQFGTSTNQAGRGVTGGAVWIIISRNIRLHPGGFIDNRGIDGNSAPVQTGSGAASAGGATRLIGQNIDLGTSQVLNTGGVGVVGVSGYNRSGNGGLGGLFIDYSGTLAGTPDITAITTHNNMYANTKGAFLFNF